MQQRCGLETLILESVLRKHNISYYIIRQYFFLKRPYETAEGKYRKRSPRVELQSTMIRGQMHEEEQAKETKAE